MHVRLHVQSYFEHFCRLEERSAYKVLTAGDTRNRGDVYVEMHLILQNPSDV